MKQIKLKYSDKSALIDDGDYDYISGFHWKYHNGYAARYVYSHGKRQRIYMHRQIMNTPGGMDTDHKDGNGLNNQRSNLRICTHAENISNQKLQKDSPNKYKGVSLTKSTGRWRAVITSNRVRKHIGYYETEEEAARAYDNAAKRYFGEFARLNFGDK